MRKAFILFFVAALIVAVLINFTQASRAPKADLQEVIRRDPREPFSDRVFYKYKPNSENILDGRIPKADLQEIIGLGPRALSDGRRRINKRRFNGYKSNSDIILNDKLPKADLQEIIGLYTRSLSDAKLPKADLQEIIGLNQRPLSDNENLRERTNVLGVMNVCYNRCKYYTQKKNQVLCVSDCIKNL